jgi:hypothetical protein
VAFERISLIAAISIPLITLSGGNSNRETASACRSAIIKNTRSILILSGRVLVSNAEKTADGMRRWLGG